MMNLETIQRTLEKNCLVNPQGLLLTGISGGPDSLCMLDALVKAGYSVIAAHFDHQLRPESGEEARFVEKMALQMGVRFILGNADVASFARNEKLSIEEACRFLRYRFLFEQARLNNANYVAVAHTADDQVETILMHLLRGAGLSGLKGMSFTTILSEWDEAIPLVRPMLCIWKTEIMEYCKENQLNPVQDATNRSNIYFRNRLRNELIPYLKTYNPQIKKILWRTTQSLSGDLEIIETATHSAWEDCCLRESDQYIELSLSKLRQLPLGLVRAVFRRGIEKLRPNLRDIDFEDVERVVSFAFNPPRSHRMNLLGGLWLWWERNSLFFAGSKLPDLEDTYPAVKKETPYQFSADDSIPLENGWLLESKLLDFSSLKQIYDEMGDPFEARLDFDKLNFPLRIRTWEPGDYIQPLGMNGRSVKLSDFFINIKLPRRVREKWPIVRSEDKIVWIPGLRLDNRFRISEKTEKVLFVKLTWIQS